MKETLVFFRFHRVRLVMMKKLINCFINGRATRPSATNIQLGLIKMGRMFIAVNCPNGWKIYGKIKYMLLIENDHFSLFFELCNFSSISSEQSIDEWRTLDCLSQLQSASIDLLATLNRWSWMRALPYDDLSCNSDTSKVLKQKKKKCFPTCGSWIISDNSLLDFCLLKCLLQFRL